MNKLTPAETLDFALGGLWISCNSSQNCNEVHIAGCLHLNADRRKLLKIMPFAPLGPLDRNGNPLAMSPTSIKSTNVMDFVA
jgi:hypothetical protein